MTKHQSIDGLPNLNRRSFIVGTATLPITAEAVKAAMKT